MYLLTYLGQFLISSLLVLRGHTDIYGVLQTDMVFCYMTLHLLLKILFVFVAMFGVLRLLMLFIL